MSSSSPQQIHLLLVDDDPDVLRSLKRVLELDFQVDTAGCAEEAEVFLSYVGCDVIVCDYNMPGRSGLDLLSDVKSNNPEMVTMLLSGQFGGDHLAERRAKEIGVDEVFAKPIDPSILASRIEFAVKMKRIANNQ